ncbi:hypothetical protein [Rhodoferax ferrireducens]|uniref:hypothetical protein n=1 Tax=Rhodoferax ferrireducens TaxID=192843 RepID=UPI00130078BA|nr:hypothetical protein [Rhodoferax ferrireducens]
MRIEITSQPRFELPLSLETVDLLMEMSRHHYDFVCKQASAVGGFIYGWRNSVSFVPESPVSATWRELDTVLKICENFCVLDSKSTARASIWRLTSDLKLAISHWNCISNQWRLTIETQVEQRTC